MIGLDPVVQDGDDDALAGVATAPGRVDVHVVAAASSAVQVPLLLEHRVVRKPGLPLREVADRKRVLIREAGSVSLDPFLLDLLLEPGTKVEAPVSGPCHVGNTSSYLNTEVMQH